MGPAFRKAISDTNIDLGVTLKVGIKGVKETPERRWNEEESVKLKRRNIQKSRVFLCVFFLKGELCDMKIIIKSITIRGTISKGCIFLNAYLLILKQVGVYNLGESSFHRVLHVAARAQ